MRWSLRQGETGGRGITGESAASVASKANGYAGDFVELAELWIEG
jgi:hypothetical protein